MAVERKKSEGVQLHNTETLLRVMEPEHRESAVEMLRAVADGKSPGVVILLREDAREESDTNRSVTLQGVFFVSNTAPAAIVRLLVDNLQLRPSDILRILEETESKGEVIER